MHGFFELVSLSSSDAEDFDDDTNELLRARHAREDMLPAYHEDSGEYVSEVNDEPIALHALARTPPRAFASERYPCRRRSAFDRAYSSCAG